MFRFRSSGESRWIVYQTIDELNINSTIYKMEVEILNDIITSTVG